MVCNSGLSVKWVARKSGLTFGLKTQGATALAVTPCFSWLRGLDLNQRPLGYEYEAAMTGNPLICLEKRSAAGSFTLSVDTSFFVLLGPVSGSYGSEMGAAAAPAG